MELTHIQKRTICEIAKEAYDLWDGREEYERSHPDQLNAFEAWRHRTQLTVVGLQSLTLCTQEHYKPLLRHFIRLRESYAAAANTPSLF